MVNWVPVLITVLVCGLIWDVMRRLERAILTSRAKVAVELSSEMLDAIQADLEELKRGLKQNNAAQASLAKDWLTKFSELETKWNQVEKRVDGRVAGAIAQLPTAGWGR
jgi:uncharacterized membrane-anchored protein YhcB (DUF1043 family)